MGVGVFWGVAIFSRGYSTSWILVKPRAEWNERNEQNSRPLSLQHKYNLLSAWGFKGSTEKYPPRLVHTVYTAQ